MCQIPNPISPPSPSLIPSPGPDPDHGGEESTRRCRTSTGGDSAAREVRKLSRASAKASSAFAVAAVVQPLVAMLPAPDHEIRIE